jgi:hypothetical protein
MNNLVTFYNVNDVDLLVKLANKFHIAKTCYIRFNLMSLRPIYLHVNIKSYNTAISNLKILKEEIIEENFDFIFVEGYNENFIDILSELNCIEIFYFAYIKPKDSILFYNLANINIIDFDIIPYDNFELKYIRDIKIKQIIECNP